MNTKITNTNFLKIEKDFSFELPILYKLFLENFEFNDQNLDWRMFSMPLKGIMCPSGFFEHSKIINNHELGFYGLYNIQELEDDWVNYSKESIELQEDKLLRIGDNGLGGGLFIGIEKDIKDKIYNVVWDSLDGPTSWSNNIFEFIRGITFVEDKSNMGDLKYSQFYKNWREKFWRVKEDVTNPNGQVSSIGRGGFDFIQFRPIEEIFGIKAIEKKYNLNFPFKFRTLLEHFKFEGKDGLDLEKIYDEQLDKLIPFEKAIYIPKQIQGQPIILSQMWNENIFLKSLENHQQTKAWKQHRLLIIGETKRGFQIGVCVEGEKSEEVWLIADHSITENGSNTIKLADDIFKFIRDIEPEYLEKYFDKIYKNWGEDFWRIKPIK